MHACLFPPLLFVHMRIHGKIEREREREHKLIPYSFGPLPTTIIGRWVIIVEIKVFLF